MPQKLGSWETVGNSEDMESRVGLTGGWMDIASPRGMGNEIYIVDVVSQERREERLYERNEMSG